MKRRHELALCGRGATAVEFAFAAPVIIMLMIGILQVAVALHAAGGVRHAIGEGVRFAKVHRLASEAEVEAHVRRSFAGVDPDKVRSLTVERGRTAGGAPFARISVAYEPQIVIPFLPPRTVRLEESRLVYLPA
jgi:hypothetical protein